MSTKPNRAPAGLSALTVVNRLLAQTLAWIAGLGLCALVVVVFVDVIFRQVINQPMLWPSEAAVILFLWSVLTGASVAAYRRGHLIIDVIPTGRWPRLEAVLRCAVTLFSLIFAGVLLYYGYRMSLLGLRRFSPMTGFPMVYYFAAFPVSGACMFLFFFEHFVQIVTGTEDPRDVSAPLSFGGGPGR